MFRKVFLDRQLRDKMLNRKNSLILKQTGKTLPKNKILKKYEHSLKNFFFSTDILIPKMLVGNRVYYQTGKGVNSIKITENMVGFKLREYTFYKKINQKRK